MKKLLVLALAALLLLPVLPVYAADRTTVTVADYNNIAEDLLVSVTTADSGFTGATIDVGGYFTQNLSGFGAGTHTANVSLSRLDTAGKMNITVTAKYGSSDSDTVVVPTTITKVAATGDGTFTLDTPAKASPYGFRAFASGGSLAAYPADNPTMWELTQKGQIDLTKLGTSLTGIVDFSYDFKSESTINEIRYRMTYNTGNGSGYTIGNESSPYYFYSKNNSGTFGKNAIPYKTGTGDDAWNHVLIRTDFINNKVYAYINGTLAECSTIKDDGVDAVMDARIIHNGAAGQKIYLDNFKLSGFTPVTSWFLNSSSYAGSKLTLNFSEDLGDLTASDIKVYNKLNTEAEVIPVSSVVKADTGKYEVNLGKTLLYGKEYDILLKNGVKSTAGSVAFKEPATDDNNDGMWLLTTVTTSKYPLNVMSVTEKTSGADVIFDNTDIAGKWSAVCWYNEAGTMVDFEILQLTEIYSGDTMSFARHNSKTYSSIKVYVFDFNTDSTSADYGATDVYEIH